MPPASLEERKRREREEGEGGRARERGREGIRGRDQEYMYIDLSPQLFLLLCSLLFSSPIAAKGSRDFGSSSLPGGLLLVAPPPLEEGPSLPLPVPEWGSACACGCV